MFVLLDIMSIQPLIVIDSILRQSMIGKVREGWYSNPNLYIRLFQTPFCKFISQFFLSCIILCLLSSSFLPLSEDSSNMDSDKLFNKALLSSSNNEYYVESSSQDVVLNHLLKMLLCLLFQSFCE